MADDLNARFMLLAMVLGDKSLGDSRAPRLELMCRELASGRDMWPQLDNQE
jgi:hypothetical protein